MKYFSNQKGAISMMAIVGVLLTIVVLVILGAYLFIKERGDVVDEPIAIEDGNTTGQEEVKIEDGETQEFTYGFLNLENQRAPGKNVIYSPLSIKYLLHLLSDGANGNTKKEIDRLIKSENLTKYQNIDKVLSLANALYIKDERKDKVLDSYIDNAKEKYDAEIKYDSFKDASNINNWVSEKTFNIINDFLKDGQVQDPNLVMILVNALAVDMKWKTEFDMLNTHMGQFNNQAGEGIKTAYMHKSEDTSDEIAYKIDNDVTVLSMDLEENEGIGLEFDAIMPNEITLEDFIVGMDKAKVEDYLSNLTKASETNKGVNITIPRFDFDYSIAFKDELKELGINDAFEMDADFSNITGDTSLFVGDAIHKADIEFSEKGVKAAAASAAIMLENAIEIDEELPISVVIDKPFMFVIRDKDTGEVWFTGTVYEPVLWEDVEAEYER